MKLPSFKRILSSDYKKDFEELIDSLSFSLNNAIESLNEGFNRNITLRDNIACTVKTVQIQTKDDKSLANPVNFKLDTSRGNVIGITVINAENLTDTVLPTAGIYIKFIQDGNSINIKEVVGLPANKKFNLTVVAYI